MEQGVIEAVLNFGILPAIALYLIFTIVRDHKEEFKKIQDKIEKESDEVKELIEEQNEAINELTHVMGKIQTTMATQVNTLIIKLIDLSNQKHGGEE